MRLHAYETVKNCRLLASRGGMSVMCPATLVYLTRVVTHGYQLVMHGANVYRFGSIDLYLQRAKGLVLSNTLVSFAP